MHEQDAIPVALAAFLEPPDKPPTFPVRVYARAVKLDPCAWCGARPAGTADHIEPRSRGGYDNPDNIAGCCVVCNQTKDGWTLLGFLLIVQLLGLPHERRL